MWWLPLAAAQCAVILHARAVLSNQPPRTYKPIESAASTDDDDDLEAANLGDLEPKLADPVAEQDRLLREKPIYADEAPPPGMGIGAKLIDLGMAAHEPAMAVGNGHEPIGQLAFQQLSLVTEPTCDSSRNDTFSASVAKAMALEEESSQ